MVVKRSRREVCLFASWPQRDENLHLAPVTSEDDGFVIWTTCHSTFGTEHHLYLLMALMTDGERNKNWGIIADAHMCGSSALDVR